MAENYFVMENLHRVFHQAPHCLNGICKEHSRGEDIQSPKGFWMRRFTCLACGASCYVGKDTKHAIHYAKALTDTSKDLR